MKKSLLLCCLTGLILINGCSSVVLMHDEQKAGVKAVEFCRTAFIDRDYQKAYDLISDEFKNIFTPDKFKKSIMDMHTSGFPTDIKATEYEPIPGQKGINIFVFGKNDNEQFYYRIYMTGVMQTGYKPSGFFRGNRQYPPSKLRKPLVLEKIKE